MTDPNLAAINLENLFDYLVPIGILILYFFLSAGKKKKSQETAPKAEPPPARPQPRPSPAPSPARPREAALRTKIEDRKLKAPTEIKDYSATIAEHRAAPSFTEQMRNLRDSDSTYDHKPLKKNSRANKLFANKSTLRQAVLLKEILNRYGE
jgi:hypothetical protein